MIATVLAMSVLVMLGAVAMTAVTSDNRLTQRDLENKQAFEAAKAGIDDYAYHLSTNTGYWASCTNVPQPHAVNQKNSTANRRNVPGNTGATYAIELLPATGQTTCDPTSITTATRTMIETSSALPGSFRIRSTGFSGKAKESIVATFKPPSFLDYVYFTQLETLDPVTFGFEPGSEALTNAYKQCELTWQEGRYERSFQWKEYNSYYKRWETKSDNCVKISFATGDQIRGPVHTNDAMAINGRPSLGRTSKDMIQVGAEDPGWYPMYWGSSPEFVGTFVTKAPKLIPPATNSQLATIAQTGYKFTGQQYICLSGTTMKVDDEPGCGGTTKNFPANGVVYISNGTCSNTTYSPFTATYPKISGCGNVYVKGSYSGQLTIAAENDIIINGDLTKSEDGMLGLIANNFVRIYHPFCPSATGTPTCTTTTAQTGPRDCNGGENGAGSITDLDIDAAILAIEHSIIVDHYDCGAELGNLNIEGALAQKFRGPVATDGSSGYTKNYVYDDRLHYIEPPSFIDPKPSQWVIGRQTLD